MRNKRAIPDRSPGTYALILSASDADTIAVGKLGPLLIRKGYYLYVGSAFGPGGIRARLGHHLRPATAPHWHIDYLRIALAPAAVWVSNDHRRREHQWAAVLASMAGSAVPLRGFGASDCNCNSHLFFFKTIVRLNTFRQRVRHEIPDHATIYPMDLSSVPYSRT